MIHEFNKWMQRIGNVYYSDNNRMAEAFIRLEQTPLPHENIIKNKCK
jgi:hypothetical protein